jgi:hypothetical protein
MTSLTGSRPLTELIPAVLKEFIGLWRLEAELARTEMTVSFRQAAFGLALAGAGAVLLIPFVFVLLFACIAALTAFGFASYWAALMVAGGILVLSFLLLVAGVTHLKATSFIPRKAISYLRSDASRVKTVFKAEP